MMKKTLFTLSFVDLFFFLSALCLFLIGNSHYIELNDKNISVLYMSFNIVYGLLVYICRNQFDNGGAPRLITFVISYIFIFMSLPILENDHFRYLWEGRVLLGGEGPYFLAPDSSLLDHIKFDARESVGFSSLTTVYPPVALIWFSIASFFSEYYRVGLIALMIMNSVLVSYIIIRLFQVVDRAWMLVLLFPMLIKEYVQAVHIDLLAFFWCFLFLTNKTTYLKVNILIVLSTFTKIIGLLFVVPVFLINKKKNMSHIMYTSLLYAAIPLFFYILYINDGLNGFNAFYGYWAWNPGFFSVLYRWFGLSNEMSRLWTQIAFIGYFLSISFILYRHKMYDEHQRLLIFSNLIFIGLMFFTPVYNAWYSIWFLVPSLLIKNKYGVLYAYLSFLCYFPYFLENYLIYSEFISHVFFIPTFLYCWKLLKTA